MKKAYILIFILALYLSVSFFRIEEIPGEWFGDISNVHEYVQEILTRKWPFYFMQSPGPLYHYLITPIVQLFPNHGYETYKIASVGIGLLGLIATYLFVAEISSNALASLTSLTMSISFWYLIWSRLGNSQIIIPALVSLLSLFIARYVKKMRLPDLLIAAFFASAGWYTYPQTFILPAVLFIFLVFLLIIKKKLITYSNQILTLAVTLIIMAIPFLNMVRSDKGNFGHYGYIGQKVLPNLSKPLEQLTSKITSNYKKTLLMLHMEGDRTFRVNVTGHPHLDRVSGVFLLVGFLYFLKKKNRLWLFFILWMLFILPLPSISPALPDAEIPNSARTVSMIPFVFLLVSAGFIVSFQFLTKFMKKKHFVALLISLIYAYVVSLNLKLYFADYVNGLPNKNLSSGRIIAEYIDHLPANINIYFGSCCWAEWGEPEPKSVAYTLRENRAFIQYNRVVENCDQIEHFPALVIFGPEDYEKLKLNMFKECFPGAKLTDITLENSELLFRQIIIPAN